MIEERRSIKRQARKGGGLPKTAILIIVGVIVMATAGGAAMVFLPQPEVIVIDGSSTVFPVTSAWAEQLNPQNPAVQYVVRFSGTGAGFEKFCRGDTHLSDASRPIRQSELENCQARGIEPVEFWVAFDGLSVVVNHQADWVDALTVKQLCRIWTSSNDADACDGAGPRVTRWNQLDSSWPDREINLWGPGTDSGTFDYFVEVILEEFGETVTDDFAPSEDDNVLVQGVANDLYALSYFGYAYAIQHTATLKFLGIDDEDPTNGEGPILPTPETIESGHYAPLGRPIFVYADANGSLQMEAVKAFLSFGLSAEGQEIVAVVGYIGLSQTVLQQQRDKIPA